MDTGYNHINMPQGYYGISVSQDYYSVYYTIEPSFNPYATEANFVIQLRRQLNGVWSNVDSATGKSIAYDVSGRNVNGAFHNIAVMGAQMMLRVEARKAWNYDNIIRVGSVLFTR